MYQRSLNPIGAVRQLRALLFFMVVLLVTEGLARKMVSSGGVLIFFLKDILTIVIGFRLFSMKMPPSITFLTNAYFSVSVLFLPLIFATGVHDPFLAIFGAKQYLLYPIVGIAMYVAYHDSEEGDFLLFFRIVALILIPTTILAVYQSRLPASHWLNLSVAGESLEGFKAGGELRVSSSFSFVAQYCVFLNAEMFIIVIALSQLSAVKRYWRILYLSLIPFLVLGCYITGSRGAVVGNLTIIVIGCLLSFTKLDSKTVFRIVTLLAFVVLSVAILPTFFPHAFVAYSSREQGQLVGYSGEVQTRVLDSLFGWTSQVTDTPPLGYGLGIMSNGSGSFSDYANTYRQSGMWTETDLATSVFEGGIYMLLVWYGFRYYVIFETMRRFISDVRGEIALPTAFCQGFILIIGVTGTLGIQPPVAIWFWFAVGTSLVLWNKTVAPKNKPDPGEMTPRVIKRIRGRSAYAERLHAEK